MEDDNKCFTSNVTHTLKKYIDEFDKYNKKKKEFTKTYNNDF